MTTLAVIERPIASLKPYERNARTHSKKQIHQIAGSIAEFGFTSPVIIDHTDTIMAGHGRVEAARSLGWSDVPTIRIEHLTPDQIRAYILADNRIAQSAGWDPEILKKEFEHLCSIETSFDIEVTGFATAEIDLIIDGESKKAKDDPADRLPEEGDNEPTVTRRGDLWLLGDHKLLCGDTRDRWPCLRSRLGQARGVRMRLGRDERGGVRRLPRDRLPQPGRGQPRRCHSLS